MAFGSRLVWDLHTVCRSEVPQFIPIVGPHACGLSKSRDDLDWVVHNAPEGIHLK